MNTPSRVLTATALFIFALTGCSSSPEAEDDADQATFAATSAGPFDKASCKGPALTVPAMKAMLEASPTGEVDLGVFSLRGRSRYRHNRGEPFGEWRTESGGIPAHMVLTWNADHTKPMFRLGDGSILPDQFGKPRIPPKAECAVSESGSATEATIIACDHYLYRETNAAGRPSGWYTATMTGTDAMFIGVLREHCAWLHTTGEWDDGVYRKEFESVLTLDY